MPSWGVGSAPVGLGADWRGEWVHLSSGPPGVVVPGPRRGGRVSLPLLSNYTSAIVVSTRPKLAALLRRLGLGVAVMLGVVAALGVVAVLPPSPGQPCWRRMSAHSWLPAWRA